MIPEPFFRFETKFFSKNGNSIKTSLLLFKWYEMNETTPYAET